MKINSFVLLITLVTNIYPVIRHVIFETKYGKLPGEIKYEYLDSPGESGAVPSTFYVDNEKNIIIDDCNNEILLVIDYVAKRQKKLLRKYCVSVGYADLKENSVIVAWNAIYKIKDDSLLLIDNYTKKNDYFQYLIEHPSGYKIIIAADNHYYFDKQFNQITKRELPVSIEDYSGIIFFKDLKAAFSKHLTNLKEFIKINYTEIAGAKRTIQVTDVFAMPDSSESPFFRHSTRFEYLGYDSVYNTYWLSFVDSIRPGLNKYNEKVKVIISYDRIGKLRFWFPEPDFEEGYEHYGHEIIVNNEGRIFNMFFYSLLGKPEDKIDRTKGIKIIEYIPEKKDFSHEERVKMYGSKKK